MQKCNLHTVKEAASMVRMGRSTLYRLVKAKQVPYRLMPNGVIRFTDEDIEQILADAHRPAVA